MPHRRERRPQPPPARVPQAAAPAQPRRRAERRLRRAGLGLLTALAAGSAAAAPPADQWRFTDGLIAVVGSTLLTIRDVTAATQPGEDRLAPRLAAANLSTADRAALRAEVRRYRLEAARDLIRRQLLGAEFQRRGYQMPSAVLDEELAYRVARLAGGDAGRFRQWLRDQGLTLAEYRDELQRDVAATMLLQREVDSHVLIAPRELAAHYAANPDRFRLPATYELQLLEVADAGLDAAARQAALAAVTAALAAGLDFGTAVQRFATGATAATGGLLPAATEPELNATFRTALAGLAEGQHSAPFRAGASTCWLHVRRFVPGRLRTFAEVSTQLRAELAQAEKARRHERYVNELRRRTYVRAPAIAD